MRAADMQVSQAADMREQRAEIQAEKDQLVQERENAKRMMAELMSLKAQLGQNAPTTVELPVEEPSVIKE